MNDSNSLEVIQQFHRRKFTGPENYAAVSKAARQAYQTLSKDEVEFLVLMALTDDKNLQNILACLACLNPGCLKDFHQTLIEQEAFNPSEIYFEANHDVTSTLIRLVTKSNEMMQRSCLLSCLGWKWICAKAVFGLETVSSRMGFYALCSTASIYLSGRLGTIGQWNAAGFVL